jgi:predicted proteasome-type protease
MTTLTEGKHTGGFLIWETFRHNGTNIMVIDTSGNLTVLGNVTAFGSP